MIVNQDIFDTFIYNLIKILNYYLLQISKNALNLELKSLIHLFYHLVDHKKKYIEKKSHRFCLNFQ